MIIGHFKFIWQGEAKMGRFAETAFHQDLFSVQLFEEEEVQDNLEHHDLDQLPLVFLNIGRRPCLMVPKYIEKECIFIANKIHVKIIK